MLIITVRIINYTTKGTDNMVINKFEKYIMYQYALCILKYEYNLKVPNSV